jgi:autotransporter-associated beta strand protein
MRIGQIMALGLLAASPGIADTYTWTAGGGADTNWSNPSNWGGGGYPQAGDVAVFTGSTDRRVGIGVGNQAASNVSVTGSAAWSWTNMANQLTVGSGGFSYGSTNLGTTWSIFSAILGGLGDLNVSAGALELLNSGNTFTGGINVAGGCLQFSSVGQLGNPANPITLGSGGNIGRLKTGAAAINGHPISLAGNVGEILPYGNLVHTSTVSGAGLLWIGPSSSGLILTNQTQNNTYGGGTRVHGYPTKAFGPYKSLGTGNVRVEYYGQLQFYGTNTVDANATARVDAVPWGYRWMNGLTRARLTLVNDYVPAIDTNSSGCLALMAGVASFSLTGPNVNARLATNAAPLGNGYMWIAAGGQNYRYFTGTSLQPNLDGVYRFCADNLNLGVNYPNNGSMGCLRGPNSVEVVGAELAALATLDIHDFSGDLTLWNGSYFSGYMQQTGGPFGVSTGTVTLNEGNLSLTGRSGGTNPVVKGNLTFRGGSAITLDSTTSAYTSRLTVASFTRADRGVLSVYPYRGRLGGLEQLLVTAGVSTSNGIAPPYFANDGGAAFLNYDPAIGFTNAAFTAASLAGSGASSIADVTSPESVPAGGAQAWALRTTANITSNVTADKVTIGSGGLILAGSTTHTAPFEFGNEGIVFLAGASTVNEFDGPISGTNGLTVGASWSGGPNQLILAATNTFTGAVTVAKGCLVIAHDAALGDPANPIVLAGDLPLASGYINTHGGKLIPWNKNDIVTTRLITVATNGGAVATVYGWKKITLAGKITGPGPLNLAPASNGFIVLTNGANDYVGGTIVSGDGTVTVEADGKLGTGPVEVRLGKLRFNGGAGTDPTARLTVYTYNLDASPPPKALLTDWTRVELVAATSTVGSIAGNGNIAIGGNTYGNLITGGNNESTEYWGIMRDHTSTYPSSLVKDGTGTFTLWNNNTYSSNTVVRNGTLLVQGSVATPVFVTSVAGSAPVLGGCGVVNGKVTATGGTLAPGGVGTVGTLRVNGNVTLDAASTFLPDVGGPGTNDALSVGGTATLGGTLNANLLSGFHLTRGETRTLISAGSVVGRFASIVPDTVAVTYTPTTVLLHLPPPKGTLMTIR